MPMPISNESAHTRFNPAVPMNAHQVVALMSGPHAFDPDEEITYLGDVEEAALCGFADESPETDPATDYSPADEDAMYRAWLDTQPDPTPPTAAAVHTYWRIDLRLSDGRWLPLSYLPAWTEGIYVTAAHAYLIAIDQIPQCCRHVLDCLPANVIALDENLKPLPGQSYSTIDAA